MKDCRITFVIDQDRIRKDDETVLSKGGTQ